MELELNEEQLEIMVAIRENLQEKLRGEPNKGSEFICNQVNRVIAAKEGKSEFESHRNNLSIEGQVKINALRDAIKEAMNGAETLNEYLSVTVPNISDTAIFNSFATLGRLAWLDRMLETKVLA